MKEKTDLKVLIEMLSRTNTDFSKTTSDNCIVINTDRKVEFNFDKKTEALTYIYNSK